MKKQLHYLSLLILLSLCGCEVTLHDNYVETEPLPLETPIEIKLDAEQNSSGELLLIEGLKVGFQINTPESQLISASFYIGDNLICETNSPQGSFDVYNNNLTGNNQVKCEITTKSLKQGESIRDQAYGGQTYMGEMSWPARFTTPKLTVYQIPEESSLENVIIHWTFNLDNFYFKVIDKGEVVVAKTKETSITLPAPSFGKQNYIEVRIVDEAGNEPFHSITGGYTYLGPGVSLKGNQMKSLYNSYSNTLYASSYNEVTSYAIPSLTTISEYKNGKGNGTPIAAAPNSDKIAVDYSDQICIFSGKELKLITTINYPEVPYAPKDILFTSDHKLVLYYNYLSKIYIYNTDNGQLEKSIFLPETNFPEEHSAATWYYQISENYLCEPVQHYGFYLTPLKNFEKGKSIFYPQGYSNYFFHPTHPHELIIVSTENNKVSILNCLSGEIIRTISKGKEYAFCNIDPVTGNYLFRNSYYALITNENGDELFRMRSEDTSPYLANNILTCWAGAAINVEPYLKKP